MDLAALVDTHGETSVLVFGGLIIGAIFGAVAQQSRFCLRAATIEFARGSLGPKLAIWLLVFTIAVCGTQWLAFLGYVPANEARQIASPQSLSGAAIGGLMFGTGMVLARGCASRLLVLSATGNLRALLSGLVFAVVAQASLRGVLSPAREALASIQTTVSLGGNDLLRFAGLDVRAAATLATIAVLAAFAFAIWRALHTWQIITSALVGITIPLAWWFTATMGGLAFEPVTMQALTFSGPSADTLMLFLSSTNVIPDFDVGLIPGVFIGSFLAAWMTGQLELQGFQGGEAMKRYLIGAALMGFGGMLAGGCAVGAGVTGASVFAVTAWITLGAMWLAAGLTDYLIDRRDETSQAPQQIALP